MSAVSVPGQSAWSRAHGGEDFPRNFWTIRASIITIMRPGFAID